MAEILLPFLIILCLLAILDILHGPFDLGIAAGIKYLLKKLSLYGTTADKVGSSESCETFNIGSRAVTINEFSQTPKGYEGKVQLNGVAWKALCRNQKLSVDTQVTVKHQDGLILEVDPL